MSDERENTLRTSSLDVDGIERLLEDPTLRTRLALVIQEQLEEPPSLWRRVGPLLASASSALVILLAFLIPSLQEQWDRFQSRQVIQRHVELVDRPGGFKGSWRGATRRSNLTKALPSQRLLRSAAQKQNLCSEPIPRGSPSFRASNARSEIQG